MRVVLVMVCCAFASSASGDWLVLKSGERIATKGVWKERGRSVVYTTFADGKLVSIPASEIDLDASRKASADQPTLKPRYEDLGTAPNAEEAPPPPPEINRLRSWIKDPSAPRVSGTMSAPGLGRNTKALAEQGREVLANVDAIAADLDRQWAEISGAYENCKAAAENAAQEQLCKASFIVARSALEEDAANLVDALDAAEAADRQRQSEEAASQREQRQAEQERRDEESAAGSGQAGSGASKESATSESQSDRQKDSDAKPPRSAPEMN